MPRSADFSARDRARRLSCSTLACLGAFACILVALTSSAQAAAPTKTDVMLLFDTSASMDGAIGEAQAEISDAVNQISSDLPDASFGVAEVRDYPHRYGTSGDFPWRLDQPVTADRAAVHSAIDGLRASGGGDPPEAYGRALWETDTNPAVGWRSGARHVIVLVADSVPHDDDLNAGIPPTALTQPSPFDTGIDPGADGVVGTSDDADWQGVLNRLLTDGVPLETDYYASDGTYLPYWGAWSAITGGKAEPHESGQLATDLVALAEAGATTPLPACGDGQARDGAGQCPVPPCPQGQAREPSGSCPSAPPDKRVSFSGMGKSAHLSRILRAAGVPFDFNVDGSATVSGLLSAGSRRAVSSDPTHIVTFTDPTGIRQTSFDLRGDGWSAAGGAPQPSSLAVTLAWPQGKPGTLSLPLFSISAGSSYENDFAQLELHASVRASLSTSVNNMASWMRRASWLPGRLRAASVSQLLYGDSDGVTHAYGTAIPPDSLTNVVRNFLRQTLPLARKLRIALPPVRSVGVGDGAFRSAKSLLAGLPTWSSLRSTTPAPGLLPGGGGPLPIGLRAPLVVGPLTPTALRHGAWSALSRSKAASAAAATVAQPLSYRTESLWTSSHTVRRGATVALLAGRLSRNGRAAVEIVDGPYAAEAPLVIRNGLAGAVVRLPANLPSGRASLAVLDLSKLRHASGRGIVALASITVG